MSRLGEGSEALLCQYGDWWFREGWRPTIARTLGQSAAVGVAVFTIGQQPGVLLALPVAGCWWCVAAWRAVDVDDDQEHDADDFDDEDDGVSPGEFVELVRALIGDGKGVHLVEVAERLAVVEPGREWSTADVRELADAAGVRLTPTRSRTRTGSTTGIRAEHLPPPSPDDGTPLEGVVVPGQTVNNNTSGVVVEEIAEGSWILRDPADRARRHTVRGRR